MARRRQRQRGQGHARGGEQDNSNVTARGREDSGSSSAAMDGAAALQAAAAGRACGPRPAVGAVARDGQATAKPRAALAHQRVAMCARGSAERGHGEHQNAVTTHSRPSDQKRVAHEF